MISWESYNKKCPTVPSQKGLWDHCKNSGGGMKKAPSRINKCKPSFFSLGSVPWHTNKRNTNKGTQTKGRKRGKNRQDIFFVWLLLSLHDFQGLAVLSISFVLSNDIWGEGGVGSFVFKGGGCERVESKTYPFMRSNFSVEEGCH